MVNSPDSCCKKKKKEKKRKKNRNWEEDTQFTIVGSPREEEDSNSYSIPSVIEWKMNEPTLMGRDG